MELLKRTGWLLAILLITNSVNLYGQDEIINVFKESYTLEQKGDFSKAIEKLNKVYLADSYEMNLRLGWLYYVAGKLTESETYYQKAINLKPYSIEARW